MHQFYNIFVISPASVAEALILQDCLSSPCTLQVHKIVLEPLLFYECNFKKGFYRSLEVNSDQIHPLEGSGTKMSFGPFLRPPTHVLPTYFAQGPRSQPVFLSWNITLPHICCCLASTEISTVLKGHSSYLVLYWHKIKVLVGD